MDYKIQRTISFIEDNLHKDIKLEELASQSAYSKFHYHRVFQTLVGEPVVEYIRKRRLIKAAYLLIYTNKKVIDIALETGYEYQQSFNRAFKSMYGCVPGEAQRNKRKILLISKLSEQLSLRRLKELRLPFLDKPNILLQGEFKVIGLECRTALKASTEFEPFKEVWMKFNKRLVEIENVTNSDFVYAIEVYNESIDDLTYNTCIEVNDFNIIPDGMISYEIPASKYLSFEFQGNQVDLQKTITYIFWRWFAECGYNFSNNIDVMVRFKRGTDPGNKDLIDANVLVPIKGKSMAMIN